ncbi:MAG: FAD-dependent oxidoreductase [Rhodospirillales bacterium]|nr:FAD-dependent oxidoreductase [Rhodospirillales bacterium]
MKFIDCVVVGAGVVGIAAARALALAGREVMVLEAAEATGTVTSSRNSDVIHAGIEYPRDSLMARLCVEGRWRRYAFCAERGVQARRCGKRIVATDEAEAEQLAGIRARAEANGVEDRRMLTASEARAMEPSLACTAALHSPP